ncbi:MAG: flavin reductase family protein [Pseudomonadota bacterium]
MLIPGSLQATRGNVDPQAFIQAMRNVASSVSVVTTDGPCGLHGATVSAFCSVSATPPSVLVCLRDDSRIAQMVRGNGSFCVNVVSSSSKHVADRFAGLHDAEIADRFDGIDSEVDDELGALISGSTAFLCDLATSHKSGSHRIFIGNVVRVVDGFGAPLAWLNGAYHEVKPLSEKGRKHA